MRRSNWTPSIVPNADDQTVCLVADDFGKIGRAWREADLEATDVETVIQDLLEGQYQNPIRIIAFNTAERWAERFAQHAFPPLDEVALFRSKTLSQRDYSTIRQRSQ